MIDDGAIVVGGGLASIDVMKVLQIESVRRALRQRGIEADTLRIEHDGIPDVLAAHGLDVGRPRPARRHALLPPADRGHAARRDPGGCRCGAPAEVRSAAPPDSRRRRCRSTALPSAPQRLPVALLVDGDRLVGLRFQHTAVEAGRAVPVEGAFEDVRAPLVVSSIGSVPEPMPGIPQDGVLYRYADPALGRVDGYDTVFGVGNVVTGKGNIMVSRRHSTEVSLQLIDHFLGLDRRRARRRGEAARRRSPARAEDAAARVADIVGRRPPLSPEHVDATLAARARPPAAPSATPAAIASGSSASRRRIWREVRWIRDYRGRRGIMTDYDESGKGHSWGRNPNQGENREIRVSSCSLRVRFAVILRPPPSVLVVERSVRC